MAEFKSYLRNIVINNGLHQDTWKGKEWKDLLYNCLHKNNDNEACQKILDDAYEQSERSSEIFSKLVNDHETEMIIRSPKKASRIMEKTKEVSDRGREYFKVLCDFLAYRINCNITDIPSKIDVLRDIVSSNDGKIYVRGEQNNDYGYCLEPIDQNFPSGFTERLFVDITQYVYVYLPEIGYIIEFQIGHPFAALTFTIDSALRDNPNCYLVDLWNGGFYEMMKGALLKQANGFIMNGVEKYDLCRVAFEIHNNSVPEKLKNILTSIL